MKKHYRWVATAGFIVILIPFLGIPHSWKVVLEFIVGLSLLVLAFIEKQMFIYSDQDTFEESNGSTTDNSLQESMFEPVPEDEEEILPDPINEKEE